MTSLCFRIQDMKQKGGFAYFPWSNQRDTLPTPQQLEHSVHFLCPVKEILLLSDRPSVKIGITL